MRLLLLPVLVAMLGCSVGDEPAPSESAAGEVLPTLWCGREVTARVFVPSLVDRFVDHPSWGEVRFRSAVDQLVTFEAEGLYDRHHGIRFGVVDGSGETSLAQEASWATANVPVWLEAGETAVMRVQPYAAQVVTGTDMIHGRSVDHTARISPFAEARFSAQCTGPLTCQTPVGQGSCKRVTSCDGSAVEGFCPGPGAVQCCVPPPVTDEDPPGIRPESPQQGSSLCEGALCMDGDEVCNPDCCPVDMDCW